MQPRTKRVIKNYQTSRLTEKEKEQGLKLLDKLLDENENAKEHFMSVKSK